MIFQSEETSGISTSIRNNHRFFEHASSRDHGDVIVFEKAPTKTERKAGVFKFLRFE